MAIVARTVHLMDPDSGELVTLKKGQEIPDDDIEEFQERFNNPTIFEDPDATDPNHDLASLTDEEFYFAADSNGVVDPETFEEQREALKGASQAGTGGVDFTDDPFNTGNGGGGGEDYETWGVSRLRNEVKSRQDAGEDLGDVDLRSKESMVAALSAADGGEGGGEGGGGGE